MDARNEIEPLDLNDYDIEESADYGREPSPRAENEDANQTQMDADLGIQDLGVDDVVSAGAVRRPRPKLDADKLLNARRGYPELLRGVRKIKYRGPGDEKKYLKKYVMTYQIWANRLWPKANFDDFVVLARKAGRDPRVRQYCRELIETEKYGTRPEHADNAGAESGGDGAENGANGTEYGTENGANGTEYSTQDGADGTEYGTENGAGGTEYGAEHGTEQTEREIEPENEHEIEHELEPGTGGADHGTDRDAFEFAEPNDDELEAAMDLYADMGF